MSITGRFANTEKFLSCERCDPVETAAMQNLDTVTQQALLAVARQDIQAALEDVMQDCQVVFMSHAVAFDTK